MSLNWLQKSILSMGFLALAFSLIWVPYSAIYAREGDNYTRDVGYALVFDPPQQSGCESAFGNRASPRALAVACTVRVQNSRVLMAAGAIGIATTALVVLSGFFRGRGKDAADFQMPHRPSGARSTVPSLADQLKSRIPKIPLSGGNCTEDDPLVITTTKDYVGVEYAIAETLLKSEDLEFKLAVQGLQERGNRAIDVLTFDIKPEGSADWTGKRTFYFDITAGFNSLKRKL